MTNPAPAPETDIQPASPAGPGRMDPAKSQRINTMATALSVSVALILVGAKLAGWIASGSIALLASFFDSLLDLAASVTAFLAVRYAARPADNEHRFGHGKAEAFSSLLQAVLVAASALFLFVEGTRRLIDPQPVEAGGWALAVMALSLVLTLGLIRMQTLVIRRTGSIAVTGDRAHYSADVLSNLAVMGGIALAVFAGLERADPILALFVGVLLAKSAFELGRESVNQLLDRELPDATRAHIEALLTDDPRVLGVHELRTRAAGPLIHIQVHMDLEPFQTLKEAHDVVVAAELRVLKHYPAADLLIHSDPKGYGEAHGRGFFDADPEPHDGGAR
ncbi:MAG: cation diffusion facilitator family transporter [Glycocaulis sp.]